MQGRVDKPEYRTGMNVCLNGYPIESGAWMRRQGTRFCATTRGAVAAVLRSFDFERAFPYVLEFSDQKMRAFAGPRLALNPGVFVLGISAASPAVVTTATPHLLLSGQSVQFLNLGNRWALIYNRVLLVTVLSPTTFSIVDPVTGTPIDGSTLGPTPTGVVTVCQVQEYFTPYSFTQAQALRLVQAQVGGVNLALLLVGSARPQLLTVATPPTSTADATFALNQIPRTLSKGNNSPSGFSTLCLFDGPYLDANISTLTCTGVAGSNFSFIIQGDYPDDRGTGLVATDVGRRFRVYMTPLPWNGSFLYQNGALVTFAGDGSFWVYVAPGQAASGTSQPGTNATQWAPVAPSQAATWNWGTITQVNGATTFNGTFESGLTQPAYLGAGVTYTKWQLGLYSDTFGWPTCGCYHEGRLGLSGVIPNRVDFSVSNSILYFTPSETDGTVTDANAISATFNSKDTNPIFWMQSNAQGVICGTQGGEWLVQATTQNLPLSPSNIQAHRVTTIGCANIEPREAGNTMVLVQRYQRKIFEYFSDVFSGRLTAPNLTETAKHLTTAGIQEIAYQRELAPIIWVRMGDGSLKGVTYKRENLMSSQGPNFAGWHRHTLGSGRTVDSICMGASSGGNLDALFMVTSDPLANGNHHVEILTDMFDEGSVPERAWFLDNAFQSTSYVVNDVTSLTINGLTHLNGKTVTAWIGALDCGDYTVASGAITVPFGDGISGGTANGLFTPAYLTSLGATPNILVGFTYTSQGQLLRPVAPAETGARNGPAFGKFRRNHYFAALLNSVAPNSLFIGVDPAKRLRPVMPKSSGGNPTSSLQFSSGMYRDTIEGDSDYDGMLFWQITRPYPCAIPAIGGFVETQDA